MITMTNDLLLDAGNVPVSDELYRTFLKTFQSLQEPMALVESPLLARPLIQQALHQDEGVLPYQALKKVFGEILALLADENPAYADLLRGRFWEGQQVEEMLTAERPMAMSRRTFANYQKNAIQTFAFLFLQAEAGRQPKTGSAPAYTAEALPPITPGPTLDPSSAVDQPKPADQHSSQIARPKLLLIGAGILLLVVVLIILLKQPTLPAQVILFEDNFEAGAGKWRADSTAWAVRSDAQGNHFYCVRAEGDYTYALTGSTSWRDYTVHLELKVVQAAKGGSGNLLWRVGEELKPFYEVDFFASDVGGAVLAKETDDYETLDQSLRGFGEGEWIPLRIEVKGDQMAVFVGADTAPILQATDANPLPQGAIGLGAGFAAGESGVWEICFDNVRVMMSQFLYKN